MVSFPHGVQDEALRRAIQEHAEALRELQEGKAGRDELFSMMQEVSSRPATAAAQPVAPPPHLSDAALKEQQKRVDALQANILAELGAG